MFIRAKRIHLVFLLVLASLAAPLSRAQPLCSDQLVSLKQLQEEFYFMSERNVGHEPDERRARAAELVSLAERILQLQGVKIERISLDTNAVSRSALRFSADASAKHRLNRFVRSVARRWKGTEIMYDPYWLVGRGVAAFFAHSDGRIGVDHELILDVTRVSDSVLHEIVHLENRGDLVIRNASDWTGTLKLMTGEQMSSVAGFGYSRYASVDEWIATFYSIRKDLADFHSGDRKDPTGFRKSRAAFEQGRALQDSLTTLSDLVAQLKDVAERALLRLESAKLKIETRRLSPSSSLESSVAEIFIDSYERRVIPGGGGTQLYPIENGTRLEVDFGSVPPKDLKGAIDARLKSWIDRLSRAKPRIDALKKELQADDIIFEASKVNIVRARAIAKEIKSIFEP